MNDKTRERTKRALLCLLLLLFATAILWATFASNKDSGNGKVVATSPSPTPTPEESPAEAPSPEPPTPAPYTRVTPKPTVISQGPVDRPKYRCPLSAPSLDVLQRVENNIKAIRETYPMVRAAGSVTVPVYFHILRNAGGIEGDVSDEVVRRQIDVLNSAFAGTGPGGTGAPTPFRFELKEIDRTSNETWFNMTYREDPIQAERDAKAALNKGDASALNIYTINLTNRPYGWARWPWDLAADLDGIVIGYTTLPGGSEYNFNQGDTATHEVGHWLGLFHTYEGGSCNPPGDYVADTPAELSGAQLCPNARNTCYGGGADPIRNFMNSTNDVCMYKFSAGQADRMDAIHLYYRPGS